MNKKSIAELEKLVDSLSNISSFEEFRKIFLDTIHSYCPFDFGVFDVYKFSKDRFLLTQPVVKSSFTDEFQRKILREYNTQYGKHSFARWLHYDRRTIISRHTDLVYENIRKKSTYYKDYLRKNGFDYGLNCEYAYGGKNYAGLTLYRSVGKANFTNTELSYLNFLSPCVISCIINADDIEFSDKTTNIESQFSLSLRESEIIDFLYRGMSNKEIASFLSISEGTVKKHISSIFQKTNMPNRQKLINFLFTEGYQKKPLVLKRTLNINS